MPLMYRVRTVFTGVPGTPWYSNLFFAIEGGTVAQARDAAATFWGSQVTYLDSSARFDVQPEVSIIESTTGEVTGVQVDSRAKGAQGGSSAAGLSPATQGLIRVRTGAYAGGREIRGRVFIPGLTTAVLGDSAPSTTAITTWNSSAAGLISDATSTWVVWSKKAGTYAVVNSATAWTQFAVMRSRRD